MNNRAPESARRPAVGDPAVAEMLRELPDGQDDRSEEGLGDIAAGAGRVDLDGGDPDDRDLLPQYSGVGVMYPEIDGARVLREDDSALLTRLPDRAVDDVFARELHAPSEFDRPAPRGVPERPDQDDPAVRGDRERSGTGGDARVPHDVPISPLSGDVTGPRRKQHPVDDLGPVAVRDDRLDSDDLDLAIAPVAEGETAVLNLKEQPLDRLPAEAFGELGPAGLERPRGQVRAEIDDLDPRNTPVNVHSHSLQDGLHEPNTATNVKSLDVAHGDNRSSSGPIES